MPLWLNAILGILFCYYSGCNSIPNLRFELSMNQFQLVRDAFLNIVGKTTSNPRLLQQADYKHKLQETIPESEPFPCPVDGFRSAVTPESVHRLMPGDIDIIGAMGDSLTAANGAAASNIFHVATENRGISWSIGGQATWREFLTLPNMLKVYNPNLFGYSLNDSHSHNYGSQFNVGEIGAMSNDLPFMAGELIKRIKSDSRVDINNHWKLITVMMGSNDFCSDICYTDTASAPERHRKNLIKMLDLLRKELPRTLVNLVISPNLGAIITKFKGTPGQCQVMHQLECPCLFGLSYQNRQDEFGELMRQWQLAEFKVARDPKYMNLKDFAVVAQPFTYNLTFPTTTNLWGETVTDFTYLSEDCFHFSQKGYSRAVTALWNNMFQPVGQKSTNWGKEFEYFICPTESSPYIFTNKNS